MGESRGGVTVSYAHTAGAGSTQTFASGGYQVEGNSGKNTLTFSGSGFPGSVSVEVGFDSDNVVLDLVNDSQFKSSASAILGEGADDLILVGQFDFDGTDNDTANIVSGNSGAIVQGDVDGNGAVDFEIMIEGILSSALSGDDFLGVF